MAEQQNSIKLKYKKEKIFNQQWEDDFAFSVMG